MLPYTVACFRLTGSWQSSPGLGSASLSSQCRSPKSHSHSLSFSELSYECVSARLSVRRKVRDPGHDRLKKSKLTFGPFPRSCPVNTLMCPRSSPAHLSTLDPQLLVLATLIRCAFTTSSPTLFLSLLFCTKFPPSSPAAT